MLSAAEIGPALYGAWRLAHFDAGGMRYFDRSLTGFWRSFQVAVLAAPFAAMLIALHLADMKIAGGWPRIVLGETIAYVIGWVAFPLLAFYLARLIEREAEYVGFIVAYNWSSLIQLAVLLPSFALAQSGVLPVALAQATVLAAQVFALVYEWFVVRTALRLPGFGAAGVVAIDLIVSVLVNGIADLLVHAS
jgi:hypothetical protein